MEISSRWAEFTIVNLNNWNQDPETFFPPGFVAIGAARVYKHDPGDEAESQLPRGGQKQTGLLTEVWKSTHLPSNGKFKEIILTWLNPFT